MSWLIELDQQLFLWLNSFHTPWLDAFMSWVTGRIVWIPFYAGLIVWFFVKQGRQAVWSVLAIVVAVALADQVTSGFMKPFFERLRPCHDPAISALVHLVDGCGGRFGFASSHAANTFALAAFISFLHPGRRALTLSVWVWALVVSYSRIYLGVHYPGDVITGAGVGVLLAFGFYRLGIKTRLLKHV